MTRPQGVGGGMGRQLGGQFGGMAQNAMQRPEVQQGMQQVRGWLQGAGMPQTMAGGGGAAPPPMPQGMPQTEGGDMRAQLAGIGGGFGTAQPTGMNRPPVNPQMLAQMLQQRR